MPLSLCSACRLPSRSVVARLPCAECLDSLLVAPPICPTCLGFNCPNRECSRPWLSITGDNGESRFDSVRAAYLSVGPGARVLKTWKTAPSPSLDRFLRAGVAPRIASYPRNRPLFLIPVPQSASRRWELAGGSVLRLCSAIRDLRRNPADRVLDLLEVGAREKSGETARSQAETRGGERYSRRAVIRGRTVDSIERLFLEKSDLAADPVLVLVDDFLTSGSTLRAAAAATRTALGKLGAFGGAHARLEVFVLGFRPALFGGDLG